MGRNLTIPVDGVYFDQIKAGTKTEEFRLVKPKWTKALEGRVYEHVIMTRGYPKRDDHANRLVTPWRGYTLKTITHPHFGDDPVEVYAIDVSAQPVEAVQVALVCAIERPKTSYLWTPADAISFTPRVLPKVYGDGRALFTITTINQRPAYWVIRGCSSWGCGSDREDGAGPDFAEMTDEILTDLEDCFGNGRCGYSGNSLFWPRKERLKNCQCEDCDERFRARWPMVDGDGGCSWSRTDWPDGFDVEPNPRNWRGNLLRAPTKAGDPAP